ncbi:signal recognition particle protein Srp19 [Thermococcus sp. M39]|uniref:signal recognition particle protein Srp19 n=1 Tax=unclassified Thermococcus TaxID=2627626 RepID=UPI00143B602A|nr:MULTISPECIES: signal recognition particle protein Srp19 [unclassified Thermococcus]NJE08059.1 signal recognition particle protein Srp19 [Thermococcus sp. M39]NJE11552.1 signal recognition particle protein Srp19 [Thermococcus sp. LS2]
MKKFVVWANELDARLSRKYGREVPKNLAVESPKLDEIIRAAEALNMKIVEVESEKMNPRLSGLDESLRTRGMLIVESRHGKSKSLKLIAQKIREFRKSKRRKK